MLSQITEELNIPELEAKFLFRTRPLSVPGDLRPVWRIGLLLSLLEKCCRGGRSTIARLHVLSWGVRNAQSKASLLAAISGELPPEHLIARVDPFLNRAIDFAIGEGLLSRVDGSKVILTQKGRSFANELLGNKDIYVKERGFIEALGQKVTEDLVNKVFGWKE